MKSFYLCVVGLLGLGLAASAACSSDDSSTGGTGGTGATGGTSQGGQAQGGEAQGGNAQGGQAQGGNAQGGQAQGGQAQGGNAQGGQGGFVSGTDCESLCDAAQTGECTQITGDCGNFCDALLAVAPLAGCNADAYTYVDCLGEPQTVCSSDCDTELGELRNCMQTYCYLHQNDQDCQTLANSFDNG